jgi:hypothetical protein
MGHGANRQGIIAHNILPGAHHVRTRSAAFLVLQRPPSQPVVERRLSAFELGELVIPAQLLGRA